MEKKIEDLEKSMKRSNDKQLKIELELCQRVSVIFICFAQYFCFCLNFSLFFNPFYFNFNISAFADSFIFCLIHGYVLETC